MKQEHLKEANQLLDQIRSLQEYIDSDGKFVRLPSKDIRSSDLEREARKRATTHLDELKREFDNL